MRANICPMCQCGDFFEGEIRTFGDNYMSLGTFRTVPVFCRVCLGCGFVAPYVDHGGLIAIREKARWPWDETCEKSKNEELREL